MKRQPIHKHIYKTASGYSITKSINGKPTYFKSLKTLNEAIEYRDRLIANNWEPLPETPEEKNRKQEKEYYKYIQMGSKGYTYSVIVSQDRYLGACPTIEEALYYRDLYHDKTYDEIPRPKDIDLITDNPYIKDGLKYPLPKRLQLKQRNPRYGKGSIVKKGRTSFHIYHGKKGKGHSYYVCACPTYEMTWYVREEMNKNGWDRSRLQEIIDNYPKYYTKLLFFYQYIHKESSGKWVISIPREFLPDGINLEHIRGYVHIEDALYERDFLVEHDWNYDLLVEMINDEDNPYYSMDLPPYPTRKIRNISKRNYKEKELQDVIDLYRQGYTNQAEICRLLDINEVSLRNWLKKFWNTNWNEFTTIIDNGDNPLELLEKVEHIIQPDLSRALPNNYSGYVHHMKNGKFNIARKGVFYGTYNDEKLAHRIVKDLRKCNWDKSKLKSIQAKHGWTSPVGSKRWVYGYGNKFAVRRKDKNRKMITYGSWHDKRIAVLVRDMLLMHGFCLDNMVWIKPLAEMTIEIMDKYKDSMFGRSTVEDMVYLETSELSDYDRYIKPAKSKNKYLIRNTVNGKNTYFGTYTREKAEEVVDFLNDNGWDKELLTVMKELGEI